MAKSVIKKGSKCVSYTEEIVQSLTGRRESLDEPHEPKQNEAIENEYDSLKSSKYEVIWASEDRAHLRVAITSNSKIKIRFATSRKMSYDEHDV